MAGDDLLREKSTAGWLVAGVDLVCNMVAANRVNLGLEMQLRPGEQLAWM